MSQPDFKYLNVPALLSRKTWVISEEAGGDLIEDPSWNRRLADRLIALVMFFQDHKLLKIEVDGDITNLVLNFSDFTEEGRRFVKSGAPDRWLASFDRDPTKSSSDVSYLVRKLKRSK